MSTERNGNIDNNSLEKNKLIENTNWYSKIWKFAKENPEIFTFLIGLIVAVLLFVLNWFQGEVVRHYFTLHDIPEYYMNESKFEFYKLIIDIGKTILLIIVGGVYIYIDDTLFYKKSESKEDKYFKIGWYLIIFALSVFLYLNHFSLIMYILIIGVLVIVLQVYFLFYFIEGKNNLFLLKILILLIIKIVYISVAVLILLGAFSEINIISLLLELTKDRINFAITVVFIFIILEIVIIIKRIEQTTGKPRRIYNKKGYTWFGRTIASYILVIILLILPIIFTQIPNPFMFPVEFRKDSYHFFKIQDKTYISLYKNESNIFAREVRFMEYTKDKKINLTYEFKSNDLKIIEQSHDGIEYKFANQKISRERTSSKYMRLKEQTEKLYFIDMNP